MHYLLIVDLLIMPQRKTLRAATRWISALLLAGGLAWVAIAPATANAPIFEDPNLFIEHPLSHVQVDSLSGPEFVDIDADGDLDVFSGAWDGNIFYYRNDGTTAAPNFVPTTGTDNPFAVVDVGSNSRPAFVDIDADGDWDAFIGEYDGILNYYRNEGTASAPVFVLVTGDDNPFDGESLMYKSAPAFVDIDSDGDFDVFVGKDNAIRYYRNEGTSSSPDFVLQSTANNPLYFAASEVLDREIAFVDLDSDGDVDALVGDQGGDLHYLRNDGSASIPLFVLQSGANNPFNGLNVYGSGSPAFIDVDGDGDSDAFVGDSQGAFCYFRNDGTSNAPSFVEVSGSANPFDNVDVGFDSEPTLVDIDDDGDFDAFIANDDLIFNYYRNDGTINIPHFLEVTGSDNPLNGFSSWASGAMAFVDIDADDDLDAFVGAFSGYIRYYRNDGTAAAPDFTWVETTNPFKGINVGRFSDPVFVDLDADADFDAFVGREDSPLLYYRNDGTATAPAFITVTGSADPFYGFTMEDFISPAFADLDSDGDWDAMVKHGDGFFTPYVLGYYRNDGTVSAPVFTEVTVNNPFDGVTSYGRLIFVDIDGDFDDDIFSGRSDGRIYFYRNYGIHHETLNVSGSVDVTFGAKENRVLLNANGVDLGDTEVYIEANAQATSVEGESVAHRYYITPTVTSGANAGITFFFSADEIPAGQSCETLNVYRWNDTGWDAGITPDSRQCAAEPYSLTVSGVSEFSPFVLRSGGAAPTNVSSMRFAAQIPGALLTAAGALLAGVIAWFGARRKR